MMILITNHDPRLSHEQLELHQKVFRVFIGMKGFIISLPCLAAITREAQRQDATNGCY